MGITAKKEEKKHLLSHEETLDLIQKVQKKLRLCLYLATSG